MSNVKQSTKTASKAVPLKFGPAPAPANEKMDTDLKSIIKNEMAQQIALALLRNPSIEKFCYGSPLEPHHCGGEASVGAYLARESLRLADDYLTEIKKRTEPQKAPVMPSEPTFANEEPESLTDDYPEA